MYGIDQTLEQTADAYRGNPQMLQQKYAQNQNLIDLLALQKLKSEKESAQREMQLKMGGKPPTVADQREQQVMDMTKQEVVQEQAGVMQNKLREQQEAQKRLMQAAGAPQGIAGVAAPNISPQMMAGGGIVAFNGTTGSAVDGNQGEEEARRAEEERRQSQRPEARSAPQASAQSGGLQAGLAALLGLRPEDVYRQRYEEVARGANFSPEERAAKERQIQERTAFDRDSELTNFLLGMAGRSTPGLAIAGGGAAAQNARNQALAARQRAEGELIDVGPASRLAGFKAAGEGERTAMTGLAQGTGDAVRLAQIGESSASRADARITADERMRLQQAESRFDANKKMIFAQMKDLGIEPGSPESVPFFSRINEVGKTIYERMQVPQYFVPEPAPGAPVAPPPKPSRFEGLGNFIQGALGLNPSTAPAARAVDFNQLQRRAQQP